MYPEKLNALHFNWSRWRAGSPSDFLIPCREDAFLGIKNRLREHTVGYCDAEHLACRPKRDNKAVMFYMHDEHFWFHMRNPEFEKVYGN